MNFNKDIRGLAFVCFPGALLWGICLPLEMFWFHFQARRFGMKHAVRRCQEPMISAMYAPYGIIAGGLFLYYPLVLAYVFMPEGSLSGATVPLDALGMLFSFAFSFMLGSIWLLIPQILLGLALILICLRAACSQIGVFILTPSPLGYKLTQNQEIPKNDALNYVLAQSEFVLPCDLRRNTFTQNLLKLRFITDFCTLERLPLGGIRQFTRDSDRRVYVNGTFGARRIVWASKQKRDECLYMLYDSCLTFCHDSAAGSRINSGWDLGDLG